MNFIFSLGVDDIFGKLSSKLIIKNSSNARGTFERKVEAFGGGAFDGGSLERYHQKSSTYQLLYQQLLSIPSMPIK